MSSNDNEFINAAKEKLGFLSNEYQFEMFIKHSQGIFLGEISFATAFLEINTGFVRRDNDFWFKFKPLTLGNMPEFTIKELLNGITGVKNYFADHIGNKTEWPITAHTFPEYFEICALELRKHCRRILTGDLSQWVDITKNLMFQRIEDLLIYYQYSGDLRLHDKDKNHMAPWIRYVEIHDSEFSILNLEKAVLDKLTR